MTITELQQQYAAHPNMAVMKRLLKDTSVQTVFCGGLCASAASLFSSVLVQEGGCPFVFILGDLEEAGYFYHDLTQILGTERVLFFPSSFRRSIKYGQKDAANEILRTEVLSRLQKGEEGLCIVTYPDALAEKVVSRKELSNKTLKLNVGEKVDTTFITDVLHSYGFEYVDYVYEPGQYAVRGSIIDVFSFASEYPYRIDFFGDEVESVRTFEVESQLSREKKDGVSIVPDLAVTGDVTTSFLDFIPKETTLAMRDFLWLRERIQVVHDEALTPQAIAVQEAEENGGITLEGKLIDGSEFTVRALDFRRLEFGNKPTGTPNASVTFNTSAHQLTDTDKICIFYQLCTQWRFMNQTFKGLYRTDVSKQSQFLPHSQQPLLRAYLCRWVIIKLRVTYSREQYGIRILANFISRFGKRIAHLVYRICTTDRIFITYLVSELLTNGIHHINALY